ncbi:WS/DGAT/MGAT family O-acyltransferase [Psychrobacter sp. FDAARGOS_221]|uniref:WS/DGAT/MGAT family O-acyltransferase n=1 Tax=Psychrobacter sp. FDAARGOS_221 TaxID=1975705 RepID=UPI000BB53248|nr:wax ester/triacylglycerol synthase family O-acyltransferase [Psychrobacter sp. FDAARGOS_221]PNK61319.1 wax ester/triacylglycerol synthase family O-acyltransferase [Psychrobacter sp. FDAARGOS_221]
MRLTSLVEQLLLLLEKRKQPMHVGGLFLFDIPNSDSINQNQETDSLNTGQNSNANQNSNTSQDNSHFVRQLVQQMRSDNIWPTFPFDQVLHNQTLWKAISQFDIHYHFHHTVLPKPHSKQAFLSHISDVHSNILDKSHPLWECHVIEGIEPQVDGQPTRFALYFKIHHALVDGIAAMRLVENSLSARATETMRLPPWALLTRNKRYLEQIKPSKRKAREVIKEQVTSIKPVFKEIQQDRQQRGNPGHVSTLQAPASRFNQRITGSRKLLTTEFKLDRFQRIADALTTDTVKFSVNDVVLAVCSGALRQYLLQLEALPEQPLIAFVPVSLRKDNSASGNQASLVLCDLGTHYDNPLQRLQAIHDSMRVGKDKFGRMQQTQVINYSALTYAWEGVNLLTSAYPKKQAFNILISNVPGPKQALYWNGAKLSSLYPASILMDGQALNITLASYLDHIHFGILGCDDILPNIGNLPELLDQSLQQFEQQLSLTDSN